MKFDLHTVVALIATTFTFPVAAAPTPQCSPDGNSPACEPSSDADTDASTFKLRIDPGVAWRRDSNAPGIESGDDAENSGVELRIDAGYQWRRDTNVPSIESSPDTETSGPELRIDAGYQWRRDINE